MTKQQTQQRIKELRAQLTGDMMQDMELREEIHELEMKLNDVQPGGGEIECVGCGS